MSVSRHLLPVHGCTDQQGGQRSAAAAAGGFKASVDGCHQAAEVSTWPLHGAHSPAAALLDPMHGLTQQSMRVQFDLLGW